MFTNWLTGTSGTSNRNHGNSNSSLTENHRSISNAALVSATNSNFLTNHAGHILMSTPPDVVLEVGPAPSTVRFVAHSIVLGMHSGYLRSAIRLDEHILSERTSSSSSSTASSNLPDFVLFLGNVTAEQFAPLLTYMYTGYLDLNVENIFGVLLATHVLHMPRALEICRAFLARAQTEGYLGARLSNSNLQNGNQAASTTLNSNNKIIRPIPSKATMPHFGFLPTTAMVAPAAAQPPPPPPPAPANQQQPIILANFKNLQRHQHQQHHSENSFPQLLPAQLESEKITPSEINQNQRNLNNERAKSEEIDVDQDSIKAASENDENKSDKEIIIKVHNEENDDDEDEEVFIDSSDDIEPSDNDIDAGDNDNDNDDDDEMEVIIEVKPKSSRQKQQKQVKNLASSKTKQENHKNFKIEKNHKKIENTKKESNSGATNSSSSSNRQQQQTKRRAIKARSGLQIAKAPIPASQLDANEGSKVIIDVASCDGPVRFRRILNTAYGHKPTDFQTQMPPERSQQSVSYSFHQQMARTIHHQQQQQRQQLQQQHAALGEESENSESSGGGGGNGGNKHSKSNNQINANEIYVCVYCKHTFKSQYCYQKHAKRHLNPLSLNPSERCDKSTAGVAAAAAALAVANNLSFNATQFGAVSGGGGAGGASGVGSSCLPLPLLATKPTANDLLRREVRPLDMNVQYYPCKTCGSKFPSYYFVHKHRKLCHADEELNVAVVEKSKNGNAVEEINKDQKSNAANTLDLKTNCIEQAKNVDSARNHEAGEHSQQQLQQHQVKHENS